LIVFRKDKSIKEVGDLITSPEFLGKYIIKIKDFQSEKSKFSNLKNSLISLASPKW
jgi:hypothetical protein